MQLLAAWFVILACLSLAPLHAQEPKLEHPGPAPRLGLLAAADAESGALRIWYVMTQTTFETRLREELVDGQRVTRSYIVPRPVQENRAFSVNIAEVEVQTATKKVLEPKEALRRLKRGSMIFFYTDDKLDERYRQLMNDDALLLRVPLANVEPYPPEPRGLPVQDDPQPVIPR